MAAVILRGSGLYGTIDFEPPSNYGKLANGMTTGPDSNLWFTFGLAYEIGKISPATGAITEYPIHD